MPTITVPQEVAQMIVNYKIHPVTAWRKYYKLSKEALATLTGFTKEQMEEIESSNLHLEPEMLSKISNIFNIFPQALEIRVDS